MREIDGFGGESTRHVVKRVAPGAVAMNRGAWIAAVFVLALVVTAGAQIDVSKLGPQIGAKAIDFTLTDQFGRAQNLGTIGGPKGTMLVFFRSADW
jgi:hypothetical protein